MREEIEMITYVPNTSLLSAKVWYLMEGGSLGIPAIVVDENGPIVRFANDPTRLARSIYPSLDLSNVEDRARIEFRK